MGEDTGGGGRHRRWGKTGDVGKTGEVGEDGEVGKTSEVREDRGGGGRQGRWGKTGVEVGEMGLRGLFDKKTEDGVVRIFTEQL